MSWLTNFVRPKIRALVSKTDVPDNLWQKCPSCGQMLFHRDLQQNLFVCQHCEHHLRIPARQRLDMLFDGGQYTRMELPATTGDPLKFRDTKSYRDRIGEARARSQEGEALVAAHGTMGGYPTVIAAFDFNFMGGSMGVRVGDALVAAAHLATLQEAAFIAVPASGGARMQEGILSLIQMPRTVIAIGKVRKAGLPYLVLFSDPTTGGVSASFAMLGDIHIAEPGATIGFAGTRVIRNTMREALPERFQTSEYMLEHGLIDMVVHRRDMRKTVIRLIDILMRPTPTAEVVQLGSDSEGDTPPQALPANEPVPGP